MTTPTLAEKIKALAERAPIMPETRCFASRKQGTIIDTLNPKTGRTVCFNRDLAEAREMYPDAEEMTVEAFCDWKSELQRTPITWEETTEEVFNDMLNVLPPAAATRGYRAFLVGEAFDHDAGNGQPRYSAFRRNGEKYERASRHMTVIEFRKETA
jgi:hypothetical protein